MKLSAKEIASFLGGEIEGNPEIWVNDFAKIEEGQENKLSFLANLKYLKFIYTTKSSVILINEDLKLEKKINSTLIRVPNAYNSFAKLLKLYQKSKEKNKKGIEKPSFISEKANLGENIYIAAFSYISENAKIGNNVKIYPNVFVSENVEIGDNTVLHSGVKIYNDCKVGENCIIHSNVVIGSDGFGFVRDKNGLQQKILQIGNVVIKNNVEIGANTTIDRATLGSTIIQNGVKLDNLIQVAHNVEIGENTVIAAQVAIAGSVKIGKNCLIAGQVGIVGHLKIANNTSIAAQSGINSKVRKENQILMGSPAFDIGKYRRSLVVFKELPEIRNSIFKIKEDIKDLKKN